MDDPIEKSTEGAIPAFDPEKMRTLIREELQQHLSAEGKDQQLYQDTHLDTGYNQPQPTVNPLQAVIDPLIAPHIQRAALAAEGARDAATFYVSHGEAIKYQGEIEKAFNALMSQGTPFTREAVWEWYRGRNFDKFLQEARSADVTKLDLAKQNADGGGGLRPGGGAGKPAHDATDDELKAAMQGVSF